MASAHPREDEPLREVAQEVMQGWVDTMASVLADAGIAPERASPLATLCVATIEGGFIMARTYRDVNPFLEAGQLLAETIATELASA